MNLKRIMALLLALTMVFALAACSKEGGGDGTATTSEAPSASVAEEEAEESEETEITSTELNIAFTAASQPHEKEYLIDTYVRNFEELYGVTVNVEFMEQADGIAKIESEQDTGNIVTDILYVDTANMAPYVNGEWVEDITSMVHEGSTITTMYDSSTNKDGARLFVPNSFDIYVLAANVDAIQYLPEGLTEEDVVNGISWEQYVEWAVNIAAGEGVGKAMMPASMEGSQLLYPMAGMSLAHGGGFPDFTSDGFKSALGLIADMAAGDAFYPEQAQYSAPTDPMKNGDVWLTFAHMGPIGVAYAAAPNEWIIGAAPIGSEGAGSTSGSWCWGVQKGAPNADLAAAWIDYVSTPEVNYGFCVNFGGVLSPIAEVAELLGDEDVVMTAGSKMLNDTIISGVPATEYSDWNAVKLLYGDAFNETVNAGQVPDDAFLGNLQEQCEALKAA